MKLNYILLLSLFSYNLYASCIDVVSCQKEINELQLRLNSCQKQYNSLFYKESTIKDNINNYKKRLTSCNDYSNEITNKYNDLVKDYNNIKQVNKTYESEEYKLSLEQKKIQNQNSIQSMIYQKNREMRYQQQEMRSQQESLIRNENFRLNNIRLQQQILNK